jgi:hypothetical protein
MSLVSAFVSKHLLKLLENEFTNHESDLQDLMITEVSQFANDALEWVKSKLDAKSDGDSNG